MSDTAARPPRISHRPDWRTSRGSVILNTVRTAEPPSRDTASGSPVSEASAAKGTRPLRHGVAGRIAQRGRP
jgi:hypothetical protein